MRAMTINVATTMTMMRMMTKMVVSWSFDPSSMQIRCKFDVCIYLSSIKNTSKVF